MSLPKKHYEKIQRGLNLSDEDLKDVMVQITKLNPKPGGNVGEVNKAESYVVPDFFIYNNAGKLELTLNSKNTPKQVVRNTARLNITYSLGKPRFFDTYHIQK